MGFWSRWQHRQTWLASAQLHKSHHSEASEIELNGSLTTIEIKKTYPSRLSWQAGTTSETQSTWLTLANHLGDPNRLYPTQFMEPPTLFFHMKGWSWLMLHHFLNPNKQATAGFSEPQQQPDQIHILASTWDSISPAQVVAISNCFKGQAGYPGKNTGGS